MPGQTDVEKLYEQMSSYKAEDTGLPPAGEEYKHYDRLGFAAYRAPSLFQPHKLRRALRDAHEGKIRPIVGYFMGMPTILYARLFAQFKTDTIWIDWEHAALGVETMTTIVHEIQMASEGRSHAIVRVPGHDHAAIGYALDAGASIVVPQVSTVEQAKHVCDAAKFGLGGTRSAPPARFFHGMSDMRAVPEVSLWENVNRQAAVIIQIENEEGVRNLDAILTECGKDIDACWIGSLDLRVSMGLDSFWGQEENFQELVELYNATLKKHDMPGSGFILPGQDPKANTKAFIVSGGDVFAFMSAKADLAAAKESLPIMSWSKPANGTTETNGSGLADRSA